MKRTREKLLPAARAIVDIENPADASVMPSRNAGQRSVLKFAAATGASLLQVLQPLLAASLTGSRQPSAVCCAVIRVTTSLTEASYGNPPTVAPRHTDSPPALCGHCHPCSARGAPGRSDVVMLAWGLCACAPPSQVRAGGRSSPVSVSTGILKRLKRKSRRLLKRLRPRRNFGVNEPLQVPNLLLLNPKLQTGLKAQVASAPSSSIS
ncbi:hypothetical protein J1605_017120 [Eschrichtius robustus]|uniref:Uncharacterized protein n=1 Tax=Eschrichtius robustus TaxID=9764 RepID=A0AB34I2K0_ESCRO|nr:hypothetical protein J1605_017120 [Eschrichtius robustus]